MDIKQHNYNNHKLIYIFQCYSGLILIQDKLFQVSLLHKIDKFNYNLKTIHQLFIKNHQLKLNK